MGQGHARRRALAVAASPPETPWHLAIPVRSSRMAEARETFQDTLDRIEAGDALAAEALFPLVYADLRAAAAALLRQERPGHTLQPTGLVHEAFLRLAGGTRVAWTSQAHFRAVAARAMRQVLVDHARRRDAFKHGGELDRVTWDGDMDARAPGLDAEVLDLHDALERLAMLSPRQARVVELRIFGGLTVQEVAHVLDVGTTTVDDDWAMARAWLSGELGGAR